MNRDVKDVGVIVEGLLGAVAMMNILRVEEENKSNWSLKKEKSASSD